MKLQFLLALVLLFSCSTTRSIKVKGSDERKKLGYLVEGTLTHSSSYCGGAAPTPEIEEEYRRQRPYKCMLYVRRGELNDENEPFLDSVSTDSEGKFQLRLETGKYVLLLANQKSKSSIDEILKMAGGDLYVDRTCLENWWTKGLFQIEVKNANIKGLDYNFYQGCFVPFGLPCFQYNGPYPP